MVPSEDGIPAGADAGAPAPDTSGATPPRAAADGAPSLDLRRYAEISVELVIGHRAAVLARHGLDEDGWEIVEDAWQARLSSALETWQDDGVPPLLAELEAAQAAARARIAGTEILALERFAAAVCEMGRGGDPVAALARAGVSAADFARASGVWTARMATDPVLAARFAQLVGAPRAR
ncbi:MAG: hypothetical protein WKG00_19175 [Polyangiaceae bacterium]